LPKKFVNFIINYLQKKKKNKMTEQEIRESICAVGKRMYQNKMILSINGNMSVRYEKILFFTPSGVNKGELTPEQIIQTDMKGNVIHGNGKPSSEIAMHLEIYKRRSDVEAIVHAHPLYCTALTIAKVSLEEVWLPEIFLQVGRIPTAPYAIPGTQELAKVVGQYVSKANAIAMERHGIVTYAKDIWEAYYNLETIEHAANILWHIRIFDATSPMTPEQVKELEKIKKQKK